MKAVALEVGEDRASVQIEPGRIARLFGARPRVIHLRWCETGGERGWMTTGSRRWLWEMPDAEEQAIEEALDAHSPEGQRRPTVEIEPRIYSKSGCLFVTCNGTGSDCGHDLADHLHCSECGDSYDDHDCTRSDVGG